MKRDLNAELPIDTAEFARALDRLGPFEAAPHIAVAVSGGPDSMALTLLAADWAKAQGGSVTAITVDHHLRAGSGDEARETGTWLKARGIGHIVLQRDGPAFSGDIQAAAREARYRLLRDWCREHGVLHLLVAHHRDDQAETLLLRLGRGSGLYGLSAMASVLEDGPCRLLRPLLSFPRSRLLATLNAAGQSSVQDPSNHNPAFSRVRLRQAMPSLADLGLSPERLVETAGRLGQSRMALEREAERLLAAAVTLHPAGFAQVDRVMLTKAPADLQARALAAMIGMIGSTLYPPRFSRLERLMAAVGMPDDFRACTLGGCKIAPDKKGILIYRELAAMPPPLKIMSRVFRWDGFEGTLNDTVPFSDLAVGSLGIQDLVTIGAHSLEQTNFSGIPKKLWPVLPVLRRHDRVTAIPHLRWGEVDLLGGSNMLFRPERPLTSVGFFAA